MGRWWQGQVGVRIVIERVVHNDPLRWWRKRGHRWTDTEMRRVRREWRGRGTDGRRRRRGTCGRWGVPIHRPHVYRNNLLLLLGTTLRLPLPLYIAALHPVKVLKSLHLSAPDLAMTKALSLSHLEDLTHAVDEITMKVWEAPQMRMVVHVVIMVVVVMERVGMVRVGKIGALASLYHFLNMSLLLYHSLLLDGVSTNDGLEAVPGHGGIEAMIGTAVVRKSDVFGGVVLELDIRILLIDLPLGLQSAPGDVRFVKALVVRPERTLGHVAGSSSLPVEMPVILDGLLAEVAHLGPAFAGHLVAPVDLDVRLGAFPTLSDEGLGHLVLDVGPLPDLGVLLHLVASQRDMRDLVAQPTGFFTTVRVLTMEDLVLLRQSIHDRGKLAEGTLLETWNVGLFNLGQLDLPEPLGEHVRVESALKNEKFEGLFAIAEAIQASLAIPYRHLKLCTKWAFNICGDSRKNGFIPLMPS